DLPQYDHIFFVPREFGYKKDGVRWQDEEVAQMVDNAILNFLNAENVKYSTITGSTAERSQKILDIVGIRKEIVKPQSAIEAEAK
ncbi:MAG: AAA family ATPase, partial [Turicibacter sp.]|nr:AAA family ATPase [Turicibacter sp.]